MSIGQRAYALAQLARRDRRHELRRHDELAVGDIEHRIETPRRSRRIGKRDERCDHPRIQPADQIGLKIEQIPGSIGIAVEIEPRH